MKIALNVTAIVAENPWPTVTLVFLLVFVLAVVVPAVWSRRHRRRRAALGVLRTIGDIAVRIATALRGTRRP